MNATTRTPAADDRVDPTLDGLIEELTRRIQAGESPDLEALLRAHPDHAEPLRQLFPALELLAGLGRRSETTAARPEADGPGPAAGVGELGDYRILREVGRGGMGVVYEAEQRSLGRRVALKTLPLAAAIDPRHLRRFHLEAQAAALLHHPGIVPVHGVGCERGIHYYVMQYIEGRNLADVLREQRRRDGLAPVDAADAGAGGPGPPAPGTGSSSRDRPYILSVARLGVQAAEALDHAHQQGVLHRDIKPSNLLVDEAGRLWVTDFGLARVQGDNGLTMTGDLLGTLRYMSPEQALARRVVIDGRSDLYSLGVTLYELLTLRPAVDGRDRAEILRRIAEEESLPIRRLNPAVPVDLETIVRKAMDKEPAGRYGSAGELAEDLRRFLDDRPIVARRPSPLDRAARWARRHRPLVAAALVGLVLAVVALAVSTAVIARERAEALRELAKVRAERRGLATGLFEVTEIVSQLMSDTLHGAFDRDRWNEVNLGNQERAIPFFEKFASQLIDDPQGQFEAAVCLGMVGAYHHELGRLDLAERSQRRAASILIDLGAETSPRPELRMALEGSLTNLGTILVDAGRPDEAEAAFRRAMDLGGVLAADPLRTPGDWSQRARLPRDFARGHFRLAGLVRDDRPELAEAILRRALSIDGRLTPDSRSDFRLLTYLAMCRYDLARLLKGMGRTREAEAAFRQSLELDREIIRVIPMSQPGKFISLGGTLNALADIRLDDGDDEEAILLLEEAVGQCHTALEMAPQNADYGRRLLDYHARLLRILARLGRHGEAAGHAEELARLGSDDPEALISAAWFLATVEEPRHRDPARAVELAGAAVERYPEEATAWNTLGVARYRAGDWTAAVEALERAHGLANDDNASTTFFLALTYWQLGEHDRARDWFDRAVCWMDEHQPSDEGLRAFHAEAAALIDPGATPGL